MDNSEQIKAIARYHQHRMRNGLNGDFELVAREWISRYARLWRQHRSASLAHARAI